MIKIIPINYIEIDEKIDEIRKLDEVMVGRYIEKYESGTSKPILVKRIGRDKYILVDGKHRLKACKNLKRNKIDCELFDGDDIYSKAVEMNQEHGIPLTKEEEETVLINLFEMGKTQEEIAKIFHIGQSAIAMRIKRNPMLTKSLCDKTNISSVNEIINGKKHEEVANIYGLSRSRITQIWNDWLNELTNNYNNGSTKQEIVEQESEKGIKLTLEKLNELIEEDYNKLIIGDCLKEIPKLNNEIIDCLIIDPPYGQDYQSHHRNNKFKKIKYDNQKAFDLLDNSLKLIKPKLNKNSHIYIFTSWKVIEKVKPIIEKYFDIKNCLVWDKVNPGMGDTVGGNYGEQYELIIFAKQGNKKLVVDKRPINILSFRKVTEGLMKHPTQKPIELIKELINNSTKENELVVDYFAGSCSTLTAAKELNRRWLGIELNEVK